MNIFLIAGGASLGVATMFPLSVRLCLPRSSKPDRWIQNCLPFSVFMLSAFPIAMGIFAVTIFSLKNLNGIDVFSATTFGTAPLLYASIAVLLFMLGFASIIVLKDFTDRPVAPYVLRGPMADEAFKLEKELRDAGTPGRIRRRRRTGTGRNSAQLHSPVHELSVKKREYQALVRLKSFREIIEHGSLVTAAYLGIAWIGTMCCVFYFWYVGVLVLSNQKLPDGTISKLLTIYILLVTWFPMRVHMDWYQNYFHNNDWFKQSNGFWLGIVVASASLIFVIFITKPEAIAIVCAVVNALVLLFVGLAGKFKPEWLRTVAEAFQSMPFVYFFGSYVIFFIVTIAIAIRILNT
jgi:hypothetical protein